MKERPILFSGPMVRAILEGRKTVTRRTVKPAPIGIPAPPPAIAGGSWTWKGLPLLGRKEEMLSQCPYGRPGDRLWVRETWARVGTGDPGHLVYRATYPNCLPPGLENVPTDIREAGYRWRPSIHMPRAASRILLEITAVRVERLQAGEGETAFESRYLAEGLYRIHHGDGEYYYSAFHSEPTAKDWCWPEDAFRELWESINGAGSWDANPWVWVVEFKRVTP